MTCNCCETRWIDTPALQLVHEFHEAFEVPESSSAMSVQDFGTDLAELRMRLIREEMKELQDAYDNRDLVGFVDAIQDLKYVLYGAELTLGIASEEHFAEVHTANMRKLGPDGKPIRREDGKVLKPEGWTGPDHDAVFDNVEERGFIYP